MEKIYFPGPIGLYTKAKREDLQSKAIQLEFESLVVPLLNSLYGFALRMTDKRVNAENLVRDTFFYSFCEFNKYHKNTSFKTWIFGVLVNIFMTAYGKNIQQLHNKLYDDGEEFFLYKKIDGYTKRAETNKEEYLDKILEKDVKNALKILPDQFRLLVHLSDIEGFSYNEIATMAKVPLRTVISRIYKGRRLIQIYLWNYANQGSWKLDRKK